MIRAGCSGIHAQMIRSKFSCFAMVYMWPGHVMYKWESMTCSFLQWTYRWNTPFESRRPFWNQKLSYRGTSICVSKRTANSEHENGKHHFCMTCQVHTEKTSAYLNTESHFVEVMCLRIETQWKLLWTKNNCESNIFCALKVSIWLKTLSRLQYNTNSKLN